MTPKAHFSRLSSRLAALRKRRAPRALDAYLESEQYATDLMGCTPQDRRIAAKLVANALAACAPGPLITAPGPKGPRWTPELKQRLVAAWAKHGSDEGIARELGLNLEAARRQRLRLIGPIRVAFPTQRVAQAA